MSQIMSQTVLAGVRENFQCIASRGWFLPKAVDTTQAFPRSEKGGGPYRKAAVLGLISYHNNKLQILLTKRSNNISFNGHACLPGGSEDSGDLSPADTALREAAEEVDLDRSKVEVVCTLPPQATTLHGLTVVRVVIALLKCSPDELNLSPNPFEVDCFYWVPLELFLEMDSSIDDGAVAWRALAYDYVDPDSKRTHHIWGLTAAMCAVVAAIALNRLHNYTLTPLLVSKLETQGETVSITFSSIALTQTQAAMIPVNKL